MLAICYIRHILPPRESSRCAGEDCGSTTIREDKKKRLAARGWKVGSTAEFLDLTPEEAAYVELKLRLADGLRDHRRRRRLTQGELARRVKSSQSRIAKMEAGDPSVTIDLLIRSLLVLGASQQDIARLIRPSKGQRPT